MANEKALYAQQWEDSASFFYDNSEYNWMGNHIRHYKKVLEIGCGTGQSTLALLQMGHTVVAIEKNEYCLNKAKELIVTNELSYSETAPADVIFLENDIADRDFLNTIDKLDYDVVICWNVGSYWSKSMFEFYLPFMVDYGLSLEQIKANPESSYGEYIQWQAGKIAQHKAVPYHIIDRGMYQINETNDPYFAVLKRELGYKNIAYANKETTSKSGGGRLLTVEQEVCKNETIKLFFNSVLMTL
ncbi:class I SAM-dependent methyltransferase [Ruminococcaceae bacterium OttesenSCG-928-N02]|nr:class I SAM-dependent methyltransferase [Ruminococcaceae bacterium OttesenSCG-928-N02]